MREQTESPLGDSTPHSRPCGRDLWIWKLVQRGQVLCLCLNAHWPIFLKRLKIFTDLKLKRKQEKPFKK